MRTYAEPPATFVRGQGTLLFDADGKEYLDFITGLAVVSLGHAHPVVADAVAEQARTLSHVSNLYGNTLAPEVARTIDRLINGGTGQAGGQVFFANSGAEANECALKLARRWAGGGRHVVISADNSFHGRTLATLTATGQPEKQAPFLPLPEGFVHVPYDDVAALDKALDPDTVAGVLLEPLQGEGGVVVPSSDYLGAVRSLCTERNALLMLDEVQTGLGRTGHWFAFQAQGLRARRRDHGKGAGQRHAGRRLLGPGRGGGGVRSRRPRLDLRRAAARAGRGEGDAGRHGGRGRVRPSPCRRRPVWRPDWSGCPAWCRCAARASCWRRSSRPRWPRRPRRSALGRGLLVNAVRPDAIRVAPPLLVRDARDRCGARDPRRRPRRRARRHDRRGRRHDRRAGLRSEGTDAWPTSSTSTTSTPADWDRVLALARPTRPGRCWRARASPSLFEKPSARTRNSTEMAVVDLGGHPVYIQGAEVGLDERETAEDVARTLACYHRVLCARVFDHAVLVRMAAALERSGFDVPVVNLLSDAAHPCQAVADVLTMREVARPAGAGAPWPTSATPTTWRAPWPRRACSRAWRCASPRRPATRSPVRSWPPCRPSPTEPGAGGTVQLTDDPHQAAKGAAVLYTDVWTSMGQEEERATRLAGLRGLHHRRRAGRPRRRRRGRAALPARAPRRGDHRRRPGGPAVVGLAPGGPPPHGHAGDPGLGRGGAA